MTDAATGVDLGANGAASASRKMAIAAKLRAQRQRIDPASDKGGKPAVWCTDDGLPRSMTMRTIVEHPQLLGLVVFLVLRLLGRSQLAPPVDAAGLARKLVQMVRHLS